MPGDIYGMPYDTAASWGYALSGQEQVASGIGYGGGEHETGSHTAFIVWLLIFVLGSVAILHGLRVGGFTFVYRR